MDAEGIDGRKEMARGQRQQRGAIVEGEAVRQGDERRARLTRMRLHRLFHLGDAANRNGICRHAEGRRGGLDEAQVVMYGAVSGLNRSATFRAAGATSLSISSHLPA